MKFLPVLKVLDSVQNIIFCHSPHFCIYLTKKVIQITTSIIKHL